MAEQDQSADRHRDVARRPGPLAWILLLPIRLYRAVISPLLPPMCRFYPSCSAYAVEALTVHGAFRGSGLTLWRLLRCGPWHPGGLDPVPPRRESFRRSRALRESTVPGESSSTHAPRPRAEE
ncbi:putative membrane protein insertion efficiency factor [Halopolyspora algeriensis]|uniref:Putative membrane protein insertion efficiency factor n=1 Tax=Halopolyspora algeriensis TaxID=1500506 RepID=A0A368VZ51_9ACTN|nr:membrane protein insertion efficiency factor YidD [Halopolyspora algeriensis]RCW47231.1 putative membrane protein insertion efficiency factor [Halopolyspora algeriensis]TQM48316.1 putative membrane protein insertion efficiency factor [Halopolyspora algeriensis]